MGILAWPTIYTMYIVGHDSCYIGAVMQCLALVDGVTNNDGGKALLPDLVEEYHMLLERLRVMDGKIVTQVGLNKPFVNWIQDLPTVSRRMRMSCLMLCYSN